MIQICAVVAWAWKNQNEIPSVKTKSTQKTFLLSRRHPHIHIARNSWRCETRKNEAERGSEPAEGNRVYNKNSSTRPN